MSQQKVSRVGGHAGRTPALLSFGRESVPPVYIPTKKVSWRKARRFANALLTSNSLIYEQIEEHITYKPHNIIIKSKSATDLEKFLPSKAYTSVYA
ncbi:MAG: hypothetical protein QXG40_08280, partial [Ignisphaera sp.]